MDWLLNLPVVWMSLVVFSATYVTTFVIYWIVKALAVGNRARAFKGVSPGLLPPLGIIFGLWFSLPTASQKNRGRVCTAWCAARSPKL